MKYEKSVLRNAANGLSLDGVLSVIGSRIADRPVDYRNYGPWWWSIKTHLHAHGYDVGDTCDINTRAEYSTGEALLDCVAGDLVRTDRMRFNVFGSPDYQMGGKEYRLFDIDIESKI